MRDILAILVCHILRFFLRLMGRNGGTTPGEIALKISPGVLGRLKYPKIYIAVTGTNGKTSVTGMIRSIFEKAGYRVVSNTYGDNLIFGVASALLASTDLGRKVRGDAVVMELDEMTFGRKFEHLRPTDVVVVNFFRDQLDRCGETATIVKAVEAALASYDGRVFVNADDPSLFGIEGITFGLSENRFSVADAGRLEAAEGRFCPKCNHRLDYRYYQYSHIGNFFCSECGFARRTPDFSASIAADDSLLVCGENYGHRPGGLYHYYNELAAIAVAVTYQIDRLHITGALNAYEKGIGRMEQVGDVLLNLVKNPTGLNQVLRHLKTRDEKRVLLFVLNDNRVDGRDVSWIWDADLSGLNVEKVICSGSRCYDMALRFKYAGEPFEIEVVEDIREAVADLKKTGGYALTTYSALVQVRGYLGE